MSIAKTLFVSFAAVALIGIGYWLGAANRSVSQDGNFQSKNLNNSAIDGQSNPTDVMHSSEQVLVPSAQFETASIQNGLQENSNGLVTSTAKPGMAIEVPINDTQIDRPTVNKIPLSNDIKKILGDGEPSKLHQKLEASEREDSWSPYMEAQLRSYLDQKPGLSVFRFPVIECRIAGCEIQGIAYVENANQIWVNATGGIYNEPWFEFKDMSTSVSAIGGNSDIIGIVVILLKERRD